MIFNKTYIKFLAIGVLSFLTYIPLCMSANNAIQSSPTYKKKQTDTILKRLDWAKKQIEKNGVKAFNAIKKHNKKNMDDLYIFIYKKDGMCILDPDPNIEGRNQFYILDASGNPIVQMLIEDTTPEGKWNHYLWTRKGSLYPEWKTTRVMTVTTPSDKKYIVGCGGFNLPVEDNFIVDFVNNFIRKFKKEGTSCFSAFKKKSARVIYGKSYIFILDNSGTFLFNPSAPSLESRNVYDYKDYTGRYLFREMIDLAAKKGEGWIRYYWNAPDDKLRPKRSFIKQVKYGNKKLIIGAGYHPNLN